jgi:hypothetical protein
MGDKQYYVKINFEYGVDNGDGTFEVKNDGQVAWYSMPYDNAVGLENYAIVPALNMMSTKAAELGLMVSGIDFTKLGIESPAGVASPGKPVK